MERNMHTISVYGIDFSGRLPINHRQGYEQLAAKLYKRFGNRVVVEFINILDREISHIYRQWPSFSIFKLPVIMFDGEPRFYGSFANEEIISALDEIIQSKTRPETRPGRKPMPRPKPVPFFKPIFIPKAPN